MQALSVRKALARILNMCLWNPYSSENVTENIIKPISIYERELHGLLSVLGICRAITAVVQLHLDMDVHC